ncbi:heat-inducible transcription repressor HrcA [Bacillaceae bacterium SIJ1]|nr:heat-inducible transcription repressor HrcA [Litoribacterium kuwaitense]
MTERQLFILQAIIENYIETAQPVGSRTLAKSGLVDFSAATIRNDMADLEELGYLEKTHSSSGRVPSEKGYRFYVDYLLRPASLKPSEREGISALFDHDFYEFEKVIQEAARIMSMLTNYTSIVRGPEMYSATLKQIQFIPVSNTHAVAIMVTDTGFIKHQTVSIPKDIELNDLERLVNLLNDRLTGVPITNLYNQILKEKERLLLYHLEHSTELYHLFGHLFGLPLHAKLYFSGKENLFTQPDFHDIEKLQALYSMIEKEEPLYELMKQPEGDGEGIRVRIGRENLFSEMAYCSLITATFSIDGEQTGTIAMLGPTRMEYGRVISLLDFFSVDLQNVIKRQQTE